LFAPATGATRRLAEPPPQPLLDALRARQVPFSVGHTIIGTVEPFADAVRSAIRDAGAAWHVVLNKEAGMALPSGVDKASGLRAALAELQVPLESTVAIGDAENDRAFMQASGRSAAVANALPSIKAIAQIVLESPDGDGVIELVDRLLL